ncbi:hypothetical protein PPYR_12419 [Photinus pyralis]|uniref:WD repeat-containing protein on Y chromosome n=2 Tax=Photinus pyralis TaxID=7054 RepID=A0A5N4AE30_PHOPY|nr:WD repeat-containing protein on Y chromosome [Photinus pyralis]KAB0795580.1 hypothetical protein PPYR_12419 [Photinus pyralis]
MSTSTSRRRKDEKSQTSAYKGSQAPSLHEQLSEDHIKQLYSAFHASHQVSMEQLATLLKDIASIEYSENEFDLLFRRINTTRNGLVTWDEFISHLILGFQEKEISAEFQSLDSPISKEPRVIRSNHRHPINRITFFPTIKNGTDYDFLDGNYLTCSKDGVINYWSLDLKLDRTVQSSSPELKVQTTWVLDLVCLPDVSVVCTSSSERDLRFYDTSARKFELRVMFSTLNEAVVSMHYEFNTREASEASKLIMGDMGGNVKILLFGTVARGPFKSQPGVPLLSVRYERLVKGLVPGFRFVEFQNLHTNWVRQVSYYKSLQCFVSCSACPKAAMVLKDITDNKSSYVYKIAKGAWCFTFCESAHLLVTGGSDSLVRLWNPFVPNKPSAIFSGHDAGVCALILQESGKFLYSISKDKCIKVWDVTAQSCLQTYRTVPSELGEYNDFTVLYNPDNRQLLLGSITLVVLELRPLQCSDHTDGTTHSLGVSVVLYNALFKVVLTCGLDSFIIVWDPWTGKRILVVKEAHTRVVYGETHSIEITAATFDPGNQLLLTGANDGTLKVWNFNSGTCLRNMSIEPGCEVTSVIWIRGRILAIGWNRHVTEFLDTGGTIESAGGGKSWDTRHSEDVFCASARIPQTLATATFNGELILWRLETGQPYRCHNVVNPTKRIKIEYKLKKEEKTAHSSRSNSTFTKKSIASIKSSQTQKTIALCNPELRAHKLSTIHIPETYIPLRGLAVHSMIFLSERPMLPGVATLLVALENGNIQVWSHHPGGSFITSFQAVHSAGDYVTSMATDAHNEYLFVGTTAGYIKTWLMTDYYPPNLTTRACLPKYRLIFPFMLKDLIDGRAKRAVRDQPKPVLLSSFKGHTSPVSGLTYINEAAIVASCSTDFTTRLWTLGGRYLGTLGTFKPWIPITIDVPPDDNRQYSIPTDLKRMASSTSFKVFTGRNYEKNEPAHDEKEDKPLTNVVTNKVEIYGKRLEEPILGNHFRIPPRTVGRYQFTLDASLPYIPVYTHLIMPPDKNVPHPRTPEGIALSQILRHDEKDKRPK